MEKRIMWLAIVLLLVGLVPAAFAAPQQEDTRGEFVVLYAEKATPAAAHAAITALGGTIIHENSAIGMAVVRSSRADFLSAVRGQSALAGATRNKPIGRVPVEARPSRDDVERLSEERRSVAQGGPEPLALQAAAGEEPLAPLQWDMQMIRATVSGSYAVNRGNRGVLVAIIDSGIDGSHPDIAPNFNAALSRNFTTDIPLIDGPCEEEPDQSCSDPSDVDEFGHGTHVAGTVAAAFNGLGVAGVAPNVTLVNARAGQDSGFVFMQPVIDALTYAADIGADVANMSFYIDPWLFNCTSNPADSPDAQMEQRTVITAVQRALNYAHQANVTLVVSGGNSHIDLGHPTIDTSSPDFPPRSAYPRNVDNSCLSLPIEGDHVIGVSAVGPSMRKAYYSNYGVERTDLSAPGGDFRDFFGTPQYRQPSNLVLSTYPESVARANGELNPDGTPNTPFVVRNCQGGTCGYYTYFQGTSMAAPHAAGVAALIVSMLGRRDARHGGLTLNPAVTETVLRASAVDHACPEPRLYTYPDLAAGFNAYCEGAPDLNGFYGDGVVDALNAVRR